MKFTLFRACTLGKFNESGSDFYIYEINIQPRYFVMFLTLSSYSNSSRSSDVMSLSFLRFCFEAFSSASTAWMAIWVLEPIWSFWGIAYSKIPCQYKFIIEHILSPICKNNYCQRITKYFDNVVTFSGYTFSFVSKKYLSYIFFFLFSVQTFDHAFVFKRFCPHSTNDPLFFRTRLFTC